MITTYDREADAAYVTFSDDAVADTVEFGDVRLVDYREDGTVLGVEFLSVSQGVRLDGLPVDREAVARALEAEHISVNDYFQGRGAVTILDQVGVASPTRAMQWQFSPFLSRQLEGSWKTSGSLQVEYAVESDLIPA